jgi:hypothetical protein
MSEYVLFNTKTTSKMVAGAGRAGTGDFVTLGGILGASSFDFDC